jgi:ClpP class serine protease
MVNPLKKIIDVKEETDSDIAKTLAEISEKNSAALLTLIAPYVGRKVTPSKISGASMGISEEFAVESAIDEIRSLTDCKNLFLLINSPGGSMISSYKVARALRSVFSNIRVFVPHIAASGGTLIALTGNEIVMGIMSHLSPLDPQTELKSGKLVSSRSVIEAHAFVTDFFKDKEVEDAPYTYKVLAEKFDAVDIQDAFAWMSLMEEYIVEILKDSGYSEDECQPLAEELVRGFKTHADVINIDRALECGNKGLHVVPASKYPMEWKAFRDWLGKYMLKSTTDM